MTWYYWIWAIVAAIIFVAFFGMVMFGTLMNSQSGDQMGAFLTFFVGTPVVAVIAATWPIWFPFAFVIDVVKSRREKRG